MVVFVTHRAGAAPVLEPLEPTSVLVELTAYALNLANQPRVVFPALGRLAATVPAVRLVAGDLDRTCAALEALLMDGETG